MSTWYIGTKSAGQGNADALYNLGSYYRTGVPQDLAKTEECYNKVAKHGSPEVKLLLSIFSRKGNMKIFENMGFHLLRKTRVFEKHLKTSRQLFYVTLINNFLYDVLLGRF